ncbi:MAG: ORF2 protein [Anelloviridae sp.]|nr:MAG: ORF2 protein [Anelloviridae sp.]
MQEYRKKEAKWRRVCSEAHKLFCNCGEWWSHAPGYPTWDTTRRGQAMGTGEGEGISFITLTDGSTSGEEGVDITPGGGGIITAAGQRYFGSTSPENKNILQFLAGRY